jgi:hypothetical protein
LVYTHVNQFKSEDGAKNWLELHKLIAAIKAAKEELAAKRLLYANLPTADDKKSLAAEILDLEHKILEMNSILTNKTMQLRNVENKFISAAKSGKKD